MHIATLARLGLLTGAMLLPSAVLAQDTPEEQEARHVLHKEQARLAAQQMGDLETRKAAVADEQAAREQTYRDALAARDADIAATRAKAAEDRARWEAAVTACLAGDRSQCAQPASPTGAD